MRSQFTLHTSHRHMSLSRGRVHLALCLRIAACSSASRVARALDSRNMLSALASLYRPAESHTIYPSRAVRSGAPKWCHQLIEAQENGRCISPFTNIPASLRVPLHLHRDAYLAEVQRASAPQTNLRGCRAKARIGGYGTTTRASSTAARRTSTSPRTTRSGARTRTSSTRAFIGRVC